MTRELAAAADLCELVRLRPVARQLARLRFVHVAHLGLVAAAELDELARVVHGRAERASQVVEGGEELVAAGAQLDTLVVADRRLCCSRVLHSLQVDAFVARLARGHLAVQLAQSGELLLVHAHVGLVLDVGERGALLVVDPRHEVAYLAGDVLVGEALDHHQVVEGAHCLD